MSEISSLITQWHRFFGTGAVPIRIVLSVAIDDEPDLLDSLVGVLGANNLQPKPFSRWLKQHEDLPFFTEDGRPLRFIRESNPHLGWRLKPADSIVARQQQEKEEQESANAA